MSILPLRDLGTVGVVTDVDPYDLPFNGFSFAKNVRFEDSKIQRGPVFRKVTDLSKRPEHIISYLTDTNEPQALVVSRDGAVASYSTIAGEVDHSPTFTPTEGEYPLSSCVLNGVVYINRSDRVPWFRPRANTTADFEIIPNDVTGTVNWPSNTRARTLRAMSGVLIATNIQKGSNSYPNMIKWSNFAINPGTPPSWDYTDPASNAGENTLAELDGSIIDAEAIRDTMFLYANNETWAMEFIGGVDMFRFARRFDRGVISSDCVAEEAGVHYVFGMNDLWMHDGTSIKSLATSKVRRFVFDTMRRDEFDQFFVTTNPRLNEVIFCYVSDDKYVKFPAQAGRGCNRAVIYNYASGTFTFADLPYVTCAAQTYLIRSGTLTFDSAVGSFDEAGGSFSRSEAGVRSSLTFGSAATGSVTQGLRTFESYTEVDTGWLLDSAANGQAYLERTGIDLDEIKAELRGYKLLTSAYPQGRLNDPSQVLTFTFGLNDHPAHLVDWTNPQTFTVNYYKLDYNIAGRYLSMKIEQSDFAPFTLSGLDIDVVILGTY